ncbi:MAG: glycine dehydrogenase (aminomethyl-transferring) [Candidatus Sedimenticola endophacoides]|uniref:Probable glycine dehydrogenase (decarboxylating) subunit 2 n=2 Tax=Candidatus Sedimenticola endophacoides TaxID=2548426 RepID=A0A6N4DYC9_9GAMM|nr:MAG: glycine dehydrogenase (aminomethyl-transferring) [Candidatus Sedimenticola endophacoides]OQX40284.1 MAG: glycine dehydrogenase (aminomethyl-transferring) [Candidatus Sedimenticola endophacoides]OQX43720.1 MAG: glycine dehydrogenase (aminomethyl-transferring) [Candidatus Sedimenticola endophacoides]PUE00227.1 MAG: glycine dehydrogenase (aminomethyl-transferring) [Candidatus Sedimenticola endophacoides]PUE03251.1 MAG: glycine dehydrogenase (aminomethyl-transferring) [Candidatus Sedimentic
MLIFEQSMPGRRAVAQAPLDEGAFPDIPEAFLRQRPAALPEVSEMQVVRHYTRLSQKNFSIDTQFYPLGSCTMKYNPRGANTLAMLPGFLSRHPEAPPSHSQGFLACMHELQEILKEVTGMRAVSLSPAAGAQGEFAGVAMIRAYHDARGDHARSEILVPDAAHGTNPATAVMCGYKVREIPTRRDGDVDVEALRGVIGPQTAGIMLTNPSTLGVFERRIEEIAALVHAAGGLLYYDGANLNAILGKVRPGDMGFDVIHVNLHKTFSTPHGGGGPGAGPVGVSERLVPYLPVPLVARDGDAYRWLLEEDCPESIGRLSAFAGNAGVLLRAYVYARMIGREGMARIAEYSALNANYMQAQLRKAGFDAAYPARRASHEFIITLRRQAKRLGVSTMDFAKRLLDHGVHAPTTYFPLLVPECLLIEPTETEDKATLDGFVEAMAVILEEAERDPERVRDAPHTLPVRRLDDVRAARELDLAWRPGADT